ncbi:MAG: hypothetical protein IJ128_04275 [Firmicutes bacterium]|nr:hypothetical protein [Bacillota bacterium]
MTKKTTAALLAVLLCLSVSIGGAVAYFSDYEEAAGAAVLTLGGKTELKEGVDGAKKTISVQNTGKTNMIVRVGIFGASSDGYMKVTCPDDWENIGDFYYYKKVLLPEASTSEIVVDVNTEWQGEKPDYNFDVTVVHEASQAVYDNDDTDLVTPDGWDDISDIIAAAPIKGVD